MWVLPSTRTTLLSNPSRYPEHPHSIHKTTDRPAALPHLQLLPSPPPTSATPAPDTPSHKSSRRPSAPITSPLRPRSHARARHLLTNEPQRISQTHPSPPSSVLK